MFVEAIEVATQFTRAIHSISRNYESDIIQPGAATLFFVNSDGWAFTCRHVAKALIAGGEIAKRRQAFLDELETKRGDKKEKVLRRKLARKHGFFKNPTFELHHRFMNCVVGDLDLEFRLHNELDVALIHFRNYERLACDSFPIFATNGSDLKPGKFLSRLGFPFAEFTNYKYDSEADKIHWTTEGRIDTPWFPIEGMVTRMVVKDSQVVEFELSTPGLRGQSGGPVFDSEGKVWGMQAATAHLDLNFDVDQEVLRNGSKKRVTDSAFLHVGRCIHIDVLKSFMTEHQVEFQEEQLVDSSLTSSTV